MHSNAHIHKTCSTKHLVTVEQKSYTSQALQHILTNPTLRRLRQEDPEFKASLGYRKSSSQHGLLTCKGILIQQHGCLARDHIQRPRSVWSGWNTDMPLVHTFNLWLKYRHALSTHLYSQTMKGKLVCRKKQHVLKWHLIEGQTKWQIRERFDRTSQRRDTINSRENSTGNRSYLRAVKGERFS